MNELEPDAQQQWLWFGAALLAMTIVALIRQYKGDAASLDWLTGKLNPHFAVMAATRLENQGAAAGLTYTWLISDGRSTVINKPVVGSIFVLKG